MSPAASDHISSPAERAFAYAGALLFAAALLHFLYAYTVTFNEAAVRQSPGAPIVNLLLFSVFALHHSVFARPAVRFALARIVPDRLERAVFVWIASVLFIATCALWQPLAGVAWNVAGLGEWVMRLIQLMGGALTVVSARAINVRELAGIEQLRHRRDRPIVFTTSGPYGWVRHPIYAAWFLFVFATPRMTATQLLFALVSSAYLRLAIPFEERSLRETSGGSYERYMRQVRWRIVPGLY